MMPNDRFEQQLPELLAELAAPRTPAYLDDLLRQTAQTNQRSTWTFLERWLPMIEIVGRPKTAPRVPWRLIGLALLVLVLLFAALGAILVGSRGHLPAPFGPARDGLIAYSDGGDIYTVNPATGVRIDVVPGPGNDIDARWSLDGAQLIFDRTAANPADGQLFVVRADGSGLRAVTSQPLTTILSYAFSPDGTQVLISAWSNGAPAILIAATDGSGVHQIDVGMPAMNLAWRPPNGAQILFTDGGDESNGYGGIYVVPAAGGTVQTVLAAAAGRYIGHPSWSPDGTQIAYGEWTDSVDVRTHVVAADGTDDRTLPIPAGADSEEPALHPWSNDGTRLITSRSYVSGTPDGGTAAVVPADGSGTGTEITYQGTLGASWEWAPDDSSILGTPTDATGTALDQVVLDPTTGTSRSPAWVTTSYPAWQRLAP